MAPFKKLHIPFYFIGHKHQLVVFPHNDKNKNTSLDEQHCDTVMEAEK